MKIRPDGTASRNSGIRLLIIITLIISCLALTSCTKLMSNLPQSGDSANKGETDGNTEKGDSETENSDGETENGDSETENSDGET